MRDLPGVLWTRERGRPRKIGGFTLTQSECRINYEPDAVDLSPASLLLPVREFITKPYTAPVSEFLNLPPFLWSKVPQPLAAGMPPNIQRRMYLRAIFAARRTQPPAPGLETDYEILMLAGRDGIGHVDVFPSDDHARRFYAERRKMIRAPVVLSKEQDLWALVRKIVTDCVDDDAVWDLVASAVGPTPSVAGMIPKLVVSVPNELRWDGSVAGPGVTDFQGRSFVDAIVKIEPPHYPGLAELENIAFDIHRRLHFEVPRTWRFTSTDGLQLLAIERFDRVGGIPLPMESFFSILCLATARRVLSPIEGSYEDVAKSLALSDPSVTADPATDMADMVRRIAVSLLTGNGDMHLENIAVVTGHKGPRLSPVFDPAPMRAYPQHGQLAAVRFFPQDPGLRGAIPSDVAERLERLAGIFGVRPRRFAEHMADILKGTATFLEEVEAAPAIPPGVQKTLRMAIEPVRIRLANYWNMDVAPAVAL
jgi:serine/threonine-protein kinase HipA